jgi:serine/threonine protein kinase
MVLAYGVIFAARERHPRRGRQPKHYALKVERHAPVCRYKDTELQVNFSFNELEEKVSNPENRYIPGEAILLRLLSGSDRFPTIDSVYVHDQFQTMVMSADSLDEDPRRNTLGSTFEYPPRHKFPGYPGTNLMQRRRKGTKLNEIQACKVASQLLEALMYLMDMNIIHDDLSHRNYLVDSELNVSLPRKHVLSPSPSPRFHRTVNMQLHWGRHS